MSEMGAQVRQGEWEHLEIRRNSQGDPLVVEAVSPSSMAGAGIPEGVEIPGTVYFRNSGNSG